MCCHLMNNHNNSNACNELKELDSSAILFVFSDFCSQTRFVCLTGQSE